MTPFRFSLLALAALAACATPASQEEAAAFDPAACYTRDFDLYFEEFDAELSPEAREVVAAMDHSLQGCRIEHVRIVGLAGARGAEQTNMDVSVRRAEVVAAYLGRATHWPSGAFELRAAGEEGAVTEEGATPMRRRAHITINAVAP